MARTLLLLAVLIAAASGRSEEAVSPFERLKSADEPYARVLACAELAQPPHRGPRALQALDEAMNRDLSERVRLAAAIAATTYPGGKTLGRIDSFLKSEPGAAVRRNLLVALSTEPVHFDNPDATRIIATLLAEDPSVEVRLAAAQVLGERGDTVALGAIERASTKDSDMGVREAARRSLLILSKPPKPRPKPKLPDPPKPDAVFGKDPCPRPWGWCTCAGAFTAKPKCMTPEECRYRQGEARNYNLDCKWDGQSEF
jgi:hypothetical protein